MGQNLLEIGVKMDAVSIPANRQSRTLLPQNDLGPYGAQLVDPIYNPGWYVTLPFVWDSAMPAIIALSKIQQSGIRLAPVVIAEETGYSQFVTGLRGNFPSLAPVSRPDFWISPPWTGEIAPGGADFSLIEGHIPGTNYPAIFLLSDNAPQPVPAVDQEFTPQTNFPQSPCFNPQYLKKTPVPSIMGANPYTVPPPEIPGESAVWSPPENQPPRYQAALIWLPEEIYDPEMSKYILSNEVYSTVQEASDSGAIIAIDTMIYNTSVQAMSQAAYMQGIFCESIIG